MKCSEAKDLFSQHTDSDADLTKNPEFVRHISECTPCRSEFEKHNKLVNALKKGFSEFNPWPDQKFSFKFPAEQKTKKSIADVISKLFLSYWKSATAVAFACIILFMLFSGSTDRQACSFYLKTGRLFEVAANTEMPGGRLATGKFKADVYSEIYCELTASNESPAYFLSKVAPGSLFTTNGNELTLESGAFWVKHRDLAIKLSIPGAKINVIGTEFLVALSSATSLIRVAEGKIELIDDKSIVGIKSGENYLREVSQGEFINLGDSLQSTWDKLLVNSTEEVFETLHSIPLESESAAHETTTEESSGYPADASPVTPPATYSPAAGGHEERGNDAVTEINDNQEQDSPIEGLGN